jgi:hypothetical protein
MTENALIFEVDQVTANLLALALAMDPNANYAIRKAMTSPDLVDSITRDPPSLVIIGETNGELSVSEACRLVRRNHSLFYPESKPFVAAIRFPMQDGFRYDLKKVREDRGNIHTNYPFSSEELSSLAEKVGSDIYFPRPFNPQSTISQIERAKALRR